MKFIIPGFYEQKYLNMALVLLMKDHPEYFHEDAQIGAIYDTFHISIWEGGRTLRQYTQASYEDMIQVRDFYAEHNIPVRFTFTNSEVQPDDLEDTFCNLSLEIFSNGHNEVLVNSPLLEAYIQDKYPNYSLISSTTKRLDQMVQFVEELRVNHYRQVCIDYDLNNRWDLYDQIPRDLISKVEFLCNPICVPNCPVRKEHYKLNGKSLRDYIRSFVIECPMPHSDCLKSAKSTNRNKITLDMIQTKYVPYGFEWFKLEGRSLTKEFYRYTYSQYLVKPKYRENFIDALIRKESALQEV